MGRSRMLVALVLAAGCGGERDRREDSSETRTASSAAIQPASTRPAETAEPACERAVHVDDGVERGTPCIAKLGAPFVVLDLGDAWAPRLFAPAADGSVPSFRATYLQLAFERDADGKPLPPQDGLSELYGVLPSLAIVRTRLADDARHTCHDQIDDTALATLTRAYSQDLGPTVAARNQTRLYLARLLERVRAKRKLPDLAALAEVPDQRATYRRWKALDDEHRGIVAAQRHLACEGFLEPKYADGTFTWRTGVALEMFQRRHFLMPNNRLDAETRAALATDSRELDFRFALRVLRERVADATGLLEDGTAGDGPQPILGRMLDPEAMRAARGHEAPLPNAAPDLISAATEAAARELGWTSPEATRSFLVRHAHGVRVAVELPPRPAYHAPHMALSAVIDRGDVWYDAQPVPRIVQRRPNLIVYVDDGGTKRPLVRWPTTIGGWADVLLPSGAVVQKWKESDVGPRLWRELYVAPTWIPPKTTPDRDLVKNLYNGRWELKRAIMGPGPRAAFGLVLLRHQLPIKKRDGSIAYWGDNGIGTHGSSSVTSIVHGTSHGCHRLYNQLAIRLGSFLLAHRQHVARGQQKEWWRRTVRYKGTFQAELDTRGYLYELTPPVPIEVTKGNIKSWRKVPPRASAPARP